MRQRTLRPFSAHTFGRATLPGAALLILCALLLWGNTAAGQTPATRVVGYGKTVTGEITSPNGSEHFFTGCVGESINVTVNTAASRDTDAGFAPRVEIFDLATDESLAAAVAGTAATTVTLSDIELPASSHYAIAVSGRSRGDRGPYTLTLDLNLPEATPRLDGALTLNTRYGDVVSDTLAAGEAGHWNFRGCDGDEIVVEVVAAGFVPEVELFAPVAEFAIARATAITQGNQTTATLTRDLPANGEYNLIVSAADTAGDYQLTLTLASRPAAITPTVTATVTATLVPTATPAPTATTSSASPDGPRGRRGIPTRRAHTATPTVAPSATHAAPPTATLIPTATLTPTPVVTATATPFLPSGDLETFCTVTTDRLNLRPGPGTSYNPPLTVLELGAFMVVIGRNADSSWLQVAVLDDNLAVAFTGWLAADFVFCVGNLEAVPVVEVEP